MRPNVPSQSHRSKYSQTVLRGGRSFVARTGTWELEIIRRCDRHRFVVLPKRWIVERTLAWISRCRRLARDYERHARKAAAFIRLAMIRLMLRRVASSR